MCENLHLESLFLNGPLQVISVMHGVLISDFICYSHFTTILYRTPLHLATSHSSSKVGCIWEWEWCSCMACIKACPH